MTALTQLPGWTDDALKALRPITPKPEWPSIFDGVRYGHLKLFRAKDDTYAVVHARADTKELVIAGLAGQGAEELFAAAVKIAQANGLTQIRFHTERRGLARLLKRFGPVVQETVYTVQVDVR